MTKQRAVYQNRTGIFCLEGRHNNLYTNTAKVRFKTLLIVMLNRFRKLLIGADVIDRSIQHKNLIKSKFYSHEPNLPICQTLNLLHSKYSNSYIISKIQLY